MSLKYLTKEEISNIASEFNDDMHTYLLQHLSIIKIYSYNIPTFRKELKKIYQCLNSSELKSKTRSVERYLTREEIDSIILEFSYDNRTVNYLQHYLPTIKLQEHNIPIYGRELKRIYSCMNSCFTLEKGFK